MIGLLVTVLVFFGAGVFCGVRLQRRLLCGSTCRRGEFDRLMADRDREMWERGLNVGAAHGRGELSPAQTAWAGVPDGR